MNIMYQVSIYVYLCRYVTFRFTFALIPFYPFTSLQHPDCWLRVSQYLVACFSPFCMVSVRQNTRPVCSSPSPLPSCVTHISNNYLIIAFGAENGSRVKYRASAPHYSFMAVLPTQPATHLHVSLITQPLVLWSTQTAKVSCLLTSAVLFDLCRIHMYAHTHTHSHTQSVEANV